MTPVEEIKERLNIVDVVGEYVKLKKNGANHKAPCPFHNEKTPSFTVSEQKQFFYCFGCGKGGDLFEFVQQAEGVEFAEALRMLAQKAGVELKNTNPKENNEKTRLLDCLRLAAEYFEVVLKQAKEAEHARGYIQGRGVTEETQKQFQLGYSPDSWNALLDVLKKHEFSEKEIEKAGLAIRSEKNGKLYDRFRGRFMFPIHNAHGNVIGFGGRTLDPEQKEAKYINSPQTPVYNKSAVLYGLHMAKQAIQKMNATVLVEGYMDVIACHQAKFRNVVASSGTALTEDQVRLLKRYSPNIILAFDSDAAGLNAAWRGMRVAIQQGMNIKVMAMPEGEDPDSLIQKDANMFRQLAIESKPFMEFAFDSVLAKHDQSQAQGKKATAAELLPIIALIPDTIEQSHYVQKLAETVHVRVELLEEKLQKTEKPEPQQEPQKPDAPQPPLAAASRRELLTDQLIAVIAATPEDMDIVLQHMKTEYAGTKEQEALYKTFVNAYNTEGKLQCEQISVDDARIQSLWQRLQLVGEETYVDLGREQLQQELLTLLQQLRRSYIQERLSVLQTELAQAEAQKDTERSNTLMRESIELAQALNE